MLDVILFLNSINGGHIKLSSNELVTVLLGANSEAFHTFCLELNPLTILMIMIISMFVIGQVGKELFCVKKSILVTFSVLIISLCKVNNLVFIAVFLPN